MTQIVRTATDIDLSLFLSGGSGKRDSGGFGSVLGLPFRLWHSCSTYLNGSFLKQVEEESSGGDRPTQVHLENVVKLEVELIYWLFYYH